MLNCVVVCQPTGALSLGWSFAAAAAKLLQLCPTLCDPIDGSHQAPIPGILQARTLEWVAISFSNAWNWKVKVKSLSRIWLLATSWTAAHQAPLSIGFSRQEYWSGVPSPSPLGWSFNDVQIEAWGPDFSVPVSTGIDYGAAPRRECTPRWGDPSHWRMIPWEGLCEASVGDIPRGGRSWPWMTASTPWAAFPVSVLPGCSGRCTCVGSAHPSLSPQTLNLEQRKQRRRTR